MRFSSQKYMKIGEDVYSAHTDQLSELIIQKINKLNSDSLRIEQQLHKYSEERELQLTIRLQQVMAHLSESHKQNREKQAQLEHQMNLLAHLRKEQHQLKDELNTLQIQTDKQNNEMVFRQQKCNDEQQYISDVQLLLQENAILSRKKAYIVHKLEQITQKKKAIDRDRNSRQIRQTNIVICKQITSKVTTACINSAVQNPNAKIKHNQSIQLSDFNLVSPTI